MSFVVLPAAPPAYTGKERERERRLAVTRTGPEHLNEFPGLILATPMENASSPY